MPQITIEIRTTIEVTDELDEELESTANEVIFNNLEKLIQNALRELKAKNTEIIDIY